MSKKYFLFENMEESLRKLPIGTKQKVKAGGIPICVFQSKEGLVAFHDQCPHLGESLSRGFPNNQNEVVCPWHSYRFNLSNGEESEHRCSPLKFIQIVSENNKLFLKL